MHIAPWCKFAINSYIKMGQCSKIIIVSSLTHSVGIILKEFMYNTTTLFDLKVQVYGNKMTGKNPSSIVFLRHLKNI